MTWRSVGERAAVRHVAELGPIYKIFYSIKDLRTEVYSGSC